MNLIFYIVFHIIFVTIILHSNLKELITEKNNFFVINIIEFVVPVNSSKKNLMFPKLHFRRIL